MTLMDVYPFAVLRVILTSERQAQLGEARTGSFVLGLAAVPVLVTFIGVKTCGLPAWTLVVAGGLATAVVWMGSRAMRDVRMSPQP